MIQAMENKFFRVARRVQATVYCGGFITAGESQSLGETLEKIVQMKMPREQSFMPRDATSAGAERVRSSKTTHMQRRS